MSLSAGTRLDRTVAVKVLPADVASTQSHASVSQKAVARKPERSNDSNVRTIRTLRTTKMG